MAFIAPFLSSVSTYAAPFIAPTLYGALGGFAVSIGAKVLDDNAAPAPQPSFISSVAKNAIFGAVGAITGLGLAKLTSWAWALIPEAAKAAAASALGSAWGTASAAFLALPVAAQIGIPVAILALVVGAIAIAYIYKGDGSNQPNPNQNQNQNQQVPAPTAP